MDKKENELKISINMAGSLTKEIRPVWATRPAPHPGLDEPMALGAAPRGPQENPPSYIGIFGGLF